MKYQMTFLFDSLSEAQAMLDRLAGLTVNVAAQPEPEPEPEPQADVPPLEDVEEALTRFYKANGIVKTRAVLAEFNAKRVGDVSDELRGELLQKLTVAE